MIISNSLQAQRGLTFGAGFLNSGGGRGYFGQFAVPWQLNTMASADSRASFPYGYGIRGYFEALDTGGIGAITRAAAAAAVSINAVGIVSLAAAGTSTVIVSVWQGIVIGGAATGNCTVTVSMSGISYIEAHCVIGASPSTIDIADAVWGRLASAYNESGTMAYELKRARDQADKSLKTGQFLALK